MLELATGGRPQLTAPAPAGANPFEHPDAQRRFRTLTDQEELARALDYPWERWSVFLHPGQRDVVERDYSGRRVLQARPEQARRSWHFTGRFTSPEPASTRACY